MNQNPDEQQQNRPNGRDEWWRWMQLQHQANSEFRAELRSIHEDITKLRAELSGVKGQLAAWVIIISAAVSGIVALIVKEVSSK